VGVRAQNSPVRRARPGQRSEAGYFVLLFPPKSGGFVETEAGLNMGFVDAARWELAVRLKNRKWLWPEFALRAADLPYPARSAAVLYISRSANAYWHQFDKYGYAGSAGAIFFFLIVSALGRREELRREEDQFVRGAQLASPIELSSLVKNRPGNPSIRHPV